MENACKNELKTRDDTFNRENQCPWMPLEPLMPLVLALLETDHIFPGSAPVNGIQINTLKETDLIFGKFDAMDDFTLINN